MAVEPVSGESASAAPVEAAATPAVEAPVIETVAETPAADPPSQTQSAIETASDADVPPSEAAPVEPKAEPAKEEAKPAEEAKAAEADAETKPAEPVAPVYAEFKLPEGIQVAPDQIEAFTTTIGPMGLTQEQGQQLMDLHTAEIKKAADALTQRQIDTFADTRKSWVNDFAKQSGNRRDTILADAKTAITKAVPNAEARAELWNVLAFTGAGDHPAVINAFAALGKRLSERPAPPTPLPAKTGPTNPADRRYGVRPST